MAFPEPQPGLVISYAYLWHHEHRAGREEGVEDRPCVIILAVKSAADVHPGQVGTRTHNPPDSPAAAFELPQAVKRHLGLDADRSWIVIDEVNESRGPFDLRPLPRSRDTFAYGFLPPRLFNALTARLAEVWAEGQGKATPRDWMENPPPAPAPLLPRSQGQACGEGATPTVSPQTPRCPQCARFSASFWRS